MKISFPPELPVSQQRDEIAEAIREHQVVIIAGETGSGKTTQLPKIALSIGRERIAHTQPRRIAARSIAERISKELGGELGGLVGYQVRFTDRVSSDTRIRLMTDGILLNAIHRDRDLSAYDTIIIDEAHERSLNIDFLLGYLKTLLPRRPDLRVIVTSATIDPESFATHFAAPDGTPAPILTVSGRTYPVEIRYRPLTPDTADETGDMGEAHGTGETGERDLFDAVGDAAEELMRADAGDILVFLSGEAEIRDASDALTGRFAKRPGERLEVLPLYGRLSSAEQHRVFQRAPAGTRRIVLATNVAETSLTVPGIRFVIDSGTARISRFSARSKVQRLPIEAISQASANQRSGRSGRTSPGIAIRLYSEADYRSRPEYTDPEILRTGLASVILQMLALGIGEVADFPFPTLPDKRGVADGLSLLTELGAVTATGRGKVTQHRITRIGRELSRLPLEPRFARMLVEAKRHGVVAEMIAIVAGLTVQDVRERPAEQRGRADELHARFSDPHGDLITLLNLWNYLQTEQRDRSSSSFRRMCKAEFLNFLRVREWMDLVAQLRRIMRSRRTGTGEAATQGAPGGEASSESAPSKSAPGTSAPSDAIHRSALAGLLSRLGVRDDRQDRRISGAKGAHAAHGRRKAAQEYLGSRGTRFVLHPASTLAKRPPEVVMSVELVETSRLFARNNAVIEPEWAEELAGDLAKRQLSEPRWEKSQGAAVAYERVTLYGVPIVERRRVQLARFDPQHARELFIRHALVDGEWESPQAFDRANRQLRREIEQHEERTRQRGLLGDDELIYDFYDARLPAEVTSTRSFEGWWKRASRTQPKLLHLTREDLIEADAGEAIDEQQFPREWRHDDQTLGLSYKFDPTADDDGVTITIPLPLLPRMESAEFEQLVPGLRHELVTALIKSLPKAIRKHVVPAADWAKRLLAALEHGGGADGRANGGADGGLTARLAATIRRETGVVVTADDFDTARLPAHLTPTYRVIDRRGRTLGAGKDLPQLQQAHRHQATQGVAKVAAAAMPKTDLERTGLTAWSFGDLPHHLDTSFTGGAGRASRGSGTVRAYPALHDRRTSVDLVLVADPDEQARLSRRGIRRLLVLSSPSPASYIRSHLSNDEKLLLGAGPYRTLDDAIADVSLAVADRVIRRHEPSGLIWRADDFARISDAYATSLIEDIYAGIALTASVLAAARRARAAIEGATSLQVLGQVSDAKAQLDGLVWAGRGHEGFVSRTGLDRLVRLPVYLDGIAHRMSQLAEQPGRDRTRQNESDRALALYAEAGGAIPQAAESPDHLIRARWLIEELRISLFAQQLRTAEPASLARLQKLLREHAAR